MVVDDDPALAEMLGIVLRVSEGFLPSLVADGERGALSAFRRRGRIAYCSPNAAGERLFTCAGRDPGRGRRCRS